MRKSRIFFKISDLIFHYPRNYKRYPSVTRINNLVYDDRFGNYTKADIYFNKELKQGAFLFLSTYTEAVSCGETSATVRLFAPILPITAGLSITSTIALRPLTPARRHRRHHKRFELFAHISRKI